MPTKQNSQLKRIAEILGLTVQSFSEDDAGMPLLSELLTTWPQLTDEDRRDVLALAVERAGGQSASDQPRS